MFPKSYLSITTTNKNLQVYHLKRYKNVEHASGKTRRFNIFKVLCDHFESPLSPGEFTLDQGLPTQNF